MRITRILAAPGIGGFFYDDQTAIRDGAEPDGESYRGSPVTPGFSAVRMPAAVLSVGLVLDDGHVSWGDGMSVQYAGVGGRDPVFEPRAAAEQVEQLVAPLLLQSEVATFRTNAECIEALRFAGGKLHTGLRYALTQALLDAAAHAHRCLPAQVIATEFDLPLAVRRVPIYAQSGDYRQANIDRMILKGVDVLPHGLINTPGKFGQRGAAFLELLAWTVRRARELGGAGYRPQLYFDLYGMAGYAFAGRIDDIVDFLAAAQAVAQPLALTIESPANFGSEAAQLEGFARLRAALRTRGVEVRIAVDEWCNTLDDIARYAAEGATDFVQIKMPDLGGLQDSIAAVLCCRRAGLGALLGGSCTETDVSARMTAQVALATQPDMVLAKPGMGVDEGLMIVTNEQSRALARLAC